MNNSVSRKVGFVIVFIAGIIAGATGLWLAIQNSVELRYFLLEQPTAKQPQAKIEIFVEAIVGKDGDSAAKLWEIQDNSPNGVQGELTKRRREVILNLMAAEIGPDYKILGIEWWTTCCEPSVTCDSRNAGGARINVQFLDKSGNPISYVFDIFAREQPYWGGAEGYTPRDWVIRDVYSREQKPLYWNLLHESGSRYISP